MKNIYFIRHGQSEHNEKKLYAGTIDSPLTELGKDQAKQTAQLLQEKNITYIISSDLCRALDTAKIIRDAINPEHTISIDTQSFLRELFFGDIQGKPYGSIGGFEYAVTSGTGESLNKLYNRGKQALDYIQNITTNGNILVVGHGSFSSVIFALNEGKNIDELPAYRKSFSFHNGEVKKLTLTETSSFS